jgi:hypothetical protein
MSQQEQLPFDFFLRTFDDNFTGNRLEVRVPAGFGATTSIPRFLKSRAVSGTGVVCTDNVETRVDGVDYRALEELLNTNLDGNTLVVVDDPRKRPEQSLILSQQNVPCVLITLGGSNMSSNSGLPLLVVDPKKYPFRETSIASLDDVPDLDKNEVLIIAIDEQHRQELERSTSFTVISQDAVDVVGSFSIVVDTAQWLANTSSPSGGIVRKRTTVSQECQERNKSLVGNFVPGTYMRMYKAQEKTEYPFLQLARVALRAGNKDVKLPFHMPLVFDFLHRFGLFDKEAREDREKIFQLPLSIRCTLSLLECQDRNVGLYTAICAAVLIDITSPQAFHRDNNFRDFQKHLASFAGIVSSPCSQEKEEKAKNDLQLLLMLWNTRKNLFTKEFRDLVSARISLVANALGVKEHETAELQDVEECFRTLFSDSIVEKVDDAGTYAAFVEGYPTAFYVLDSVLQSELRNDLPSSLIVLSNQGKWIRIALSAK